jgi:hypothetical protein
MIAEAPSPPQPNKKNAKTKAKTESFFMKILLL